MQDVKTRTENEDRKALGRGLSSLFSENRIKKVEPEGAKTNASVKEINVAEMAPSKFQPRTDFNEENLRELRDSIRKSGVIQPIVVRQSGHGKYEIIAGERRWRAAKLAGLTQVPVVIREMTDKQALEAALIENIQRQDLNPLEEAQSYKRLTKEFNYTQETIANSIGKSRSYVTNMMRLVALPDAVKEMLTKGELTMGHARALLNSNYPFQHAKTVVTKGLNVRQTEALVVGAKTIKTVEAVKKRNTAKNPDIVTLEKSLTNRFSSKVNITVKDDNSGSVVINYKNLEHLDAIINLIGE